MTYKADGCNNPEDIWTSQRSRRVSLVRYQLEIGPLLTPRLQKPEPLG